jgi:hypothetical protein
MFKNRRAFMAVSIALALVYLLVQMQPAEAVPLPDTPDPSQPSIKVLSPLMRTYNSSTVNLRLEIEKPSSWFGQLGYFPGETTRENFCIGKIDSVQVSFEGIVSQRFAVADLDPLQGYYLPLGSKLDSKVDFSANLNVPEGKHTLEIIIFATSYYYDTHFVMYQRRSQSVNSSVTIPFSIWYSSPEVSMISPQNHTYSGFEVPLTFEVDRSAVCVYSLDGAGNSSQLVGNITLAGLAVGSHSLVVYATDAAGNTGKSEDVFFEVTSTPHVPTQQPTPEPTPSPSPSPSLIEIATPKPTATDSPSPAATPSPSPSPSPTPPFLSGTALAVVIAVVVIVASAVVFLVLAKRKR